MKKKSNKKDVLFIMIVVILLLDIICVIINDILVEIQMKEIEASGESTLQGGPIQKLVNKNRIETIDFKGVKITKLATYDITGVVLGMEYYYFGGGANRMSPEDLVLAWGPAATSKYSDDISVKIGGSDRFLNYSIKGDYYRDYKDTAGNYISNNHIIPINGRIKNILKKVRKGDVVQIVGYLVECKGDNWHWGPSSMSRTDSGAHACEIILAESICIIE